MSKYHRLRTAIAKHDWTTPEGLAAGLRDELELVGYGTAFQIFRGGVPIDEEAARQAIVDEIPAIDGYQQSLQRLMRDDPRWRDMSVLAESDPAGQLMFEHGDFRRPLGLGGLEVVFGPKKIEQRLNRRTKGEIGRAEREKGLREKLEDTRDTDETFYLFHANQCGYLVRNTTMRFWRTGVGQRGTSVMTHIAGITLPELQEFVDSTGRETLAGVSTHVDPEKGGEDGEDGVTAMHGEFAREIIDFLNLELEVDIDGIKRQYGESRTDSKFQSVERWGADRETVLARLIDRRGKPDEIAEITKQFNLGYGSLKYGGA